MDELLHALRIKGRATIEELAAAVEAPDDAVRSRLERLQSDGLAFEHAAGQAPGWLLTPAGRALHAEQARADVSDLVRAQVLEHYRGFLRVDDPTKQVCACWQTTPDDGERARLLRRLRELHGQAAPVLASAARTVPRFERYGHRLAAALERAGRDSRYVVGLDVDSYHTAWSECHEDFLVTLGRSRHAQASW